MQLKWRGLCPKTCIIVFACGKVYRYVVPIYRNYQNKAQRKQAHLQLSAVWLIVEVTGLNSKTSDIVLQVWHGFALTVKVTERQAAKLRIKGVYAVPPSGVSSFTKIIGRGAVSVLPLPQ